MFLHDHVGIQCNSAPSAYARSYGIVLFEVEQGVFERAGAMILTLLSNGKDMYDGILAVANSYIDSLPVEEIEIL
jgi:hypothetical protein